MFLRFRALFTVVICAPAGLAFADHARPNIVLIMIDDLGWTDLHIQGNELLETPVIDRLAGVPSIRDSTSTSAAPASGAHPASSIPTATRPSRIERRAST